MVNLMINENLERLENELEQDYILRLCELKYAHNWTWQGVADIANEELGQEYTASRYRSIYERNCTDITKRRSTAKPIEKDLINEKIIALDKAKYQFYDQRTAYNKVIRNMARAESVCSIIKNEIKSLVPQESYFARDIDFEDNDMIINLNDIHYDLIIDNYWNKYSPEIARKRLEAYLDKIKQKKNIFGCQNCYLLLGGDNISGNIHKQIAISNREGIVKQAMGVAELIAWFVMELHYLFPLVVVVGANGNHSRIEKKDDSSFHDRLDMIIPWYLKARLADIDGVVIQNNDIDDSLSLIEMRGKNYLLVHGDMDSITNPYKLIDMLGIKIEAIFLAHKHTNQLQWVQGVMCLMSGSLCGMEDFCVEKRIKGQPQQLICIVDKNGIENLCNINLNIV